MPTSLPDHKVEAFKYTSLAKLVAPEAGRSELRHSPALTGVSVTPLTEKLALPATPLTTHALEQADNGWLIEASGENKSPLELEITASGSTTGKVLLRLSKNARLCVFEDTAKTTGLANQLWQIELAEGAQLCHVRLQNSPIGTTHLATSNVNIGRDAQYKLVVLNTGASLSRYEPHINLDAPGAEASLTAINLLNQTQHGDITSVLRHNAPHGSSRQMVRSVLAGSSRGVYQGQIVVAPGAQKTSAQQSSKALLLSPSAEMDTKPELEIYADDVQCGHGATTGSLDMQALYYLRSRGVPEAEARMLLISGFIAEALSAVESDSLRLRLDAQVAKFMEALS